MPQTAYDATTGDFFQIDADNDGPLLKNESGAIGARNAGDTAYGVVRAGAPVGNDDVVSKGAHEGLDSLVHNLAETSYEEVTRTGGVVTDVIVWTNSGKTVKIRDTAITRAAGQVSVIVDKQYDGAGSLLQTMTGTISRTGGQVDSIDWVES